MTPRAAYIGLAAVVVVLLVERAAVHRRMRRLTRDNATLRGLYQTAQQVIGCHARGEL